VEALRGLIEYALDAGDVEFCSAETVARRAMADAEVREREVRPVDADAETYPEL
jgi:hypothetical protein